MKKTLISLLLMTLILTLMPVTALADSGYTYIDENGDTQTTGALTVTPITADTDTMTTGWYG